MTIKAGVLKAGVIRSDGVPFFDDFTSYATGSLPSSWKEGQVEGDLTETLFDWTVENDATSPTGKKLTMPDRNAIYVGSIWWQPDGSQINLSDGDVLVCFRWNDDCTMGIYTRCSSMTEDDKSSTYGTLGTGYHFVFYEISNNIWLRYVKETVTYDEATHSSFPITTPTISYSTFTGEVVGDWFWMRVNLNGSALRARAWKDGDAEPGTWQIDTTDATYSSGALGLVFYTNAAINEQAIAYFSYSTDPATPAVGPA